MNPWRGARRALLFLGLFLLAPGAPCRASEAGDLNERGIAALERGDYPAAVTAFAAALKAEPADATIKRNLAIAYNNYAIALLNADKFDDAVAVMRKALEIEPYNDELLGNLARAYNSRGVALIEAKSYQAAENYLLEAIRYLPGEATFRQNLAVAMTYQAEAFYSAHLSGNAFAKLREALQYDPQNTAALMLLGQICYERQEIGWAIYYFRAAYRLEPVRYAALADRIKQLERELAVEGAFERQDYGAFDIRYDGDLKELDLTALRADLSDAYYGVGGLLGYYPKGRVVVLLYSPEDFARIRSVPDWVAGLYDGKIRVPASEKMDDDSIKRLIRHEYTHALVSELGKDRCATWLNEGLAKYMEYHDVKGGMPKPLLEKRAKKGTLILFDELQGQFIEITDPEKVALAYEQSCSMVEYIVEAYGMWKIVRMLGRYAAGSDTKTVLSLELHRTPEGFEQDWLRWLK